MKKTIILLLIVVIASGALLAWWVFRPGLSLDEVGVHDRVHENLHSLGLEGLDGRSAFHLRPLLESKGMTKRWVGKSILSGL